MPRNSKITPGRPPSTLTGQLPVSSQESPWWDGVASEILSREGMVGRTLTIEELAQIVPSYPDGGRPRPRAVARRLRPILELVGRGPNGSLGRGATYRIVRPGGDPEVGRQDVRDETIAAAAAWLQDAVRRMTGGE